MGMPIDHVLRAEALGYDSVWTAEAYGSDAITPLAFPIPAESGGAAMDTTTDLVNAGLAASTGQLSSFNKGRGIGDCGSNGQWRWDGERFHLASYAMMGDCRGVTPDLWPVLWRSVD